MTTTSAIIAPRGKIPSSLINLIKKEISPSIKNFPNFDEFYKQFKEKISNIIIFVYCSDQEYVEEACKFTSDYEGQCLFIPIFDGHNLEMAMNYYGKGIHHPIIIELFDKNWSLLKNLDKIGFLAMKQKEIFSLKEKVKKLTKRESDVLSIIALGFTNQEAAIKLGISPRTVEIHRANIAKKMDMNFVNLVRIMHLLF